MKKIITLILIFFILCLMAANIFSEEIATINSQEVQPEKIVNPEIKTITNNVTANILEFKDKYKYSKYPDVFMDGDFETKYSNRDYLPSSQSGTLWQTIQNDPIYQELPRDVLRGPGKLETRYRFNIEGKLEDNISVFWDIEQEPDFPGKYDIRVKYYKTEITFGDLDANYKNGDFIELNKSLNGVKVTSYDNQWRSIVATGKERSTPKMYMGTGDGRKMIKLANKYILEGSVKVILNNTNVLAEKIDYTVNYFEGEVTFTQPKSRDDNIKIIYEFTNPIEDFLPISNRKNFFGIQYNWAAPPDPIEVLATGNNAEKFVINNNMLALDSYPKLQLKFAPLVKGSEVIMYKNKALKREIDYTIKYNEGSFILINKKLEGGSLLSISYSYFLTGNIEENLEADEGKGPYKLSYKNILPESLVCIINGEKMQPEKDYVMDSLEGKLYFNFPVNKESVLYLTYKYIIHDTIIPTKDVSPLNVGVAYIEESVRQKPEGLLSYVSNEDEIVSLNVLETYYKPIDPSQDITIKINNAEVPTTNIDEINYYKGIIRFKDNTHDKASIKINYTYKKSYLAENIFQGINGYNNSWYSSQSDFVLDKVPVKYKGIYSITLWGGNFSNTTILNEGLDYEADYGTNGQILKIRFFTKVDKTASQLTEYPNSATRIKVKYYYIPDLPPDVGNVMQKMVGFSVKSKMADNWNVNSEVALAQHNFSKPRQDNIYEFYGNGKDNFIYPLRNKNLVENSEFVYLNNVLQTKDTDYYISYPQGTIRFRNLTPSANDKIRAQYQYYNTGITEAGVEKQTTAFKVGTDYQIEDKLFYGSFKFVDKDFFPIGELKDERGLTNFLGGMKWMISEKENLDFSYEKRSNYKGLNDAGTTILLIRDEINTIAKLNLMDYFLTSQKLNYFTEVQGGFESAATRNTHIVDTQHLGYQIDSNFGPDSAKFVANGSLSHETQDYLDREALVNYDLLTYGLAATLKPYEGEGYYEKLEIKPYFNISNDRSETGKTITMKRIHNLSFSTDYQPIKILNIRFSNSQKENILESTVDNAITKNIDVIKNQHLFFSLIPYSWLDTSYDYNHSESESPLLRQRGRIEDLHNYGINRYSPYDNITAFNNDFVNLCFSPLKNSNLTTKWSNNKINENNDKSRYVSGREYYVYSDFEPIQGIKFGKITYEKNNSKKDDLAQTTEVSANIANNTSSKKEGDLSVKIFVPIVDLFSYKISLSDKKEKRDDAREAYSATSNFIYRDLPEYNKNHTLGFDSGEIWILGRLSASVKEQFTDAQNTEEQIASSNVSSNRTSLNYYDVKNLNSRIYNLSLNPFKLVNLSGKYYDAKEYYNRNNNIAIQGTIYNINNILNLSGSYSPISIIELQGNYDKNKTFYWASSTVDIKLAGIQENFKNHLDFLNITKGGNIIFTPISLISFKVGYQQNTIDQISIETGISTTAKIKQEILISGLALRPREAMTLSGDFLTKRTYNNDIYQGQGGSLVTKAVYNPTILENLTINILGELTYTKGKDLNYLERAASLQGTQQETDWRVVNRDDIQAMLSLNIDIKIPLPTVRYIEKVVISGVVKIKTIKDFVRSENNYNISGVVLSGKILF